MWTIIATWEMAFDGVSKARNILKKGGLAADGVEIAVKTTEDNPEYKSVGYGGLPNGKGELELDAAFMDGDSLSIGAIAGIRDFKNPISIARELSRSKVNNFLVGQGAEEYAKSNNFERKVMLTEEAKSEYHARLKRVEEEGISPYSGHDTIGAMALGMDKTMAVGTSTSGLFMKKKGRAGDSPISGSGFYVDSSIGGATATGLGEDIMKGCISYEIVRLMEEGYTPQEAADKAVFDLDKKLRSRRGKAGDISVVCMNNKGEIGAATNIEDFSFVVAGENMAPTVYTCSRKEGKTIYERK